MAISAPRPWVSNLPATITLALIAAVGIGVPLLNLLAPAGSALHVPTYMVSLIGKYLCYALLALSVDLIWGYCGILSLGHGAFFALGGYAMGMHLMRRIGERGVYGNAELPDFMVFLNWKELPWYWHGFDSFAFTAAMVVAVPGLLAFLFGWFAFRSRVTGVYLSIISQALTFALMLAFFRNDMGFGGNNGLTDFKDILGFNLQADGTRVGLFAASAAALALGYLLCRFIVTSRLGKVLVAIRDAESRTRFLGYPVEYYKLFVFVISAVMAGIAGALYVPQVGIINPGEFAPANSIEIVIWVAVGGRGTLHGAILGALLVNYAKSYLTGAMPEVWLFALGALFVAVTLFLPKGVIGAAASGLRRRLGRPAVSGGARRTTRRGPRRMSTHIHARAEARDTLLYLNGVSVSFDGFKALNSLSFYVIVGELRAIIGPNGAGKTTMMDVVTGKTRPDSGDVVFNGGVDLTALDEARIANLGIGRKFQKPTVFDGHSVYANLELALAGGRNVFASLFFRLSRAQCARIDAVLETIALTAARDRLAGSLSHGQRQWLEIGMLLAQDPQLLLVDEPVAGMTDGETEQTAVLLKEINKSHTVVVVEHDMTFVRSLDCPVTVLHEGRVLAEGTLADVQRNKQVVEVYLGR